MTRRPGRGTLAVHGTPHRLADDSAVTTPIYQSSTFTQPAGAVGELRYTRYGNNPNQIEVAQRYAALEGAERSVFLASGMAATSLAHLAVLRPGDHLLASRWIYGGTRELFDNEFGRLGIEVSYVDPEHPRDWRRSLRKNTRALFLEVLTNPLMRVVDLTMVAQIAHERGLALLVDSTFASPIALRPLEHGADLVITSATKYLGGHSDVIAGAVAGSESVIDEVTRLMQNWGASIDPHAAWLVERGMKTLAIRIERATANAAAIARWAGDRDEFTSVHWPGLADHPDHQIATRLLDSYGAMVGLVHRDGIAGAARMTARLQIIRHAPSLAGVESLVSEPRLTSHRNLTPAERRALGIPDGFLRLSCGIEDAADLIGDLSDAL